MQQNYKLPEKNSQLHENICINIFELPGALIYLTSLRHGVQCHMNLSFRKIEYNLRPEGRSCGQVLNFDSFGLSRHVVKN